MDALDIFRTRLAAEMERQEVTQDALAERAKSHRQSVAKVLRGERNVNLAFAERLARGLGFELSDFLKTPKKRQAKA